MRVFLAITVYNCTGVFGGWVEARFIRIIPEREISSAGMKLAGENHPWERNLIGKDEISWRESSLGEKFHREDETSRRESSLREKFNRQG